jgi:hypothetical protein
MEVTLQAIYSKRHDGEGLARVYENKAWMVGLKNYKPANDAGLFTEIERHRQSDELFLLLEGSCVLLSAFEERCSLRFEAQAMKTGALYVIPFSVWHTTITTPGARLALVEDPGTGAANSDVRVLSAEELEAARNAIAAAPT